MTEISKAIKARRKHLGITQRELSEKSGVKYNTLIKIESGAVKNPKIDTMQKLANALLVMPSDLMAGEWNAPFFAETTCMTSSIPDLDLKVMNKVLEDFKPKPLHVDEKGNEYDTMLLPKDIYEKIQKDSPGLLPNRHTIKLSQTSEEGASPMWANMSKLRGQFMEHPIYYGRPVARHDWWNFVNITS